FKVTVVYLAGAPDLKGDALTNFTILQKLAEYIPGQTFVKLEKLNDLEPLQQCSVIFDCLLGTGTAGELKEPYKSVIGKLNEFEMAKIAVDIPSGLNADTGYAGTAFNADLTVTLAALKRGLFVGKGPALTGKVVKGYIGMPDNWFESQLPGEFLIEAEDALNGLPVKEQDIYKYSAGKVLVIAGSSNLPGASALTSGAVLKSGAGACYLAFPASGKTVVQQMLNEVIVSPYPDDDRGYLTLQSLDSLRNKFDWMDVLAIGPGLGREKETKEAIVETLKRNKGKRIVIDADAIFALGDGSCKNIDLRNCIFTPHQAEFAHLLGVELKELQKDVLSYGRSFASDTSSFLVLKGAPTVIFNPEGEAFINTTGNPGMAKFGTGDVLTGVIAGILSQTDEIENALISAVYIHSLSADLLLKSKTEYSFVASDIIDNLPNAINYIRNNCV
ncbi:MAG: NAD(P)H-hydrate dehydratase, partial [Syntrophothermus sp.]